MSATSCLMLRAEEVGGLQPPLRHRGAHLQRSRNPLKVTVPIPASPTDVPRLPSPSAFLYAHDDVANTLSDEQEDLEALEAGPSLPLLRTELLSPRRSERAPSSVR
jgi:hypothetical protein